MHKSKSVVILKTLSKRELKKFDDFIQSPFFNKSQQATKLYTILKSQYPNFEGKNSDRTHVYKKLFPNTAFHEQKLRYVMTDLTKVLESYIAYQESSLEESKFLLQAYSKKGLDKYFNKTAENWRDELAKGEIRDNNYHFQMYTVEEQCFAYDLSPNKGIKSALEKIFNHLDLFYIGSKLKYFCEIINYNNVFRNTILNENKPPLFLEEIMEVMKEEKIEHDPLLKIYYNIYHSLTEPDNEQHYLELLENLNNYKDCFTEKELHDMYIYARNYCIRKLNTGHSNYLRKLFELFQQLQENGILPYQGVVSQWDYKNMVSISLRMGEYDFAEKIIQSYKKYIPEQDRQNAYYYNLAHFHFFKKDFGKSMELLQRVEFTNTYYHSDTKILMVKNYYDMEEIISLFNTIDTFKAYLRRNKQASDLNKSVYFDFLSNVKKLTRIKLGSKKSLKDLKADVASSRQIGIHTDWLYAKIEELENNKRR